MADCIINDVDGVRVITFNRPERMNSMGGTMLQEMTEAVEAGNKDDSVRVYVVTGSGRAWCAGADLQAMGAPREGGEARRPPRHETLDYAGAPGRLVRALYNSDRPTIAAVNGVTVGGGFGLCSVFDIRIASDQARFNTIFVKRAIGPDYGLSWFLPKLVGYQRAAEMFFQSRFVEAQEALEIGLVAKVVPHEQLMDEAMTMARTIAKSSPNSIINVRRALQRSFTNTLDQQMEFEWLNQQKILQSPEFQEGVRAFIEKREPDYSKF